ncbi:MAG: hypothetical protein WBG46_11300 [Nonlabens sp.]
MDEILKNLAGILLFVGIVICLWVIPIWFGIKWAKIKGVSRLWMLSGIHPFFGWIAYLVLRYGVDPRKQCEMCKESIKIGAYICRYCGNQMSKEDVNFSIQQFKSKA